MSHEIPLMFKPNDDLTIFTMIGSVKQTGFLGNSLYKGFKTIMRATRGSCNPLFLEATKLDLRRKKNYEGLMLV